MQAVYFAFDHPEANNCTREQAQAALLKAWQHPGGILCHNAKFDYDVATTHMGMPELPWDKIHDTMFLVFMDDPDAASHGLKESAERLLGMPPEEQQAVREWLIKAGFTTRRARDWGAFIAQAPGDLVGSYAVGDVVRTERLFTKLMPTFKKRKMLKAYYRERQLMPCLLDMERRGVPVDVKRLECDCRTFGNDLRAMTVWIKKRLHSPDLNISSGEELVAALIAAKKIDLTKLGKTPKSGEWKTDKDSLEASITDVTLNSMLAHYASLMTCMNTFMQPWLTTAQLSGGRIFTQWNQLKQYGAKGVQGAVTGRLSSTPNFQNIPKEFPPFWKHQAKELRAKLIQELNEKNIIRVGEPIPALGAATELVLKLPTCPLELHELPLVRSYIVAPKGRVLLNRDYSQQELRILAHYEDGQMKADYLANPWLDIHDHARLGILEILSMDFARSLVKQINFGLIYGMGIDLMAQKADCTSAEAKAAKRAVLSLYPGLKNSEGTGLIDGLWDLAANGQPLRTWGGRLYFCEQPKMIAGRMWTFEYKMLNRLVQGSAADQTKQAIINYYETKPKDHYLLLTVHDELLSDVPEQEADMGMEVLRKAMEFNPFEIPMLSEGKLTATNWAELVAYDKKGERVM